VRLAVGLGQACQIIQLRNFSSAAPHPFFSLEHSSRHRVRKSTSVMRPLLAILGHVYAPPNHRSAGANSDTGRPEMAGRERRQSCEGLVEDILRR